MDQGITWKDLIGTSSRFQLYGFLRLDSAFNTARFNDPQIPYIVRSPSDPGNGANAKQDEFTMHARLTRLGLRFDGSEIDGIGDPNLGGKVEVDFYNIGLNDSDSRNALRMRLAYLNLDWGRWSLRAGQDWDVISPLYPVVNNDLVMWGAGNVGDRRPQLTARNEQPLGERSQFVTEFGVALAGAVGGRNVQGGLTSGEASGQPMFNARFAVEGKCDTGAYQVGLWGHQSQQRFDATGAGEANYDSHSIGIDARVPLVADTLGLAGEYFMGKNLRDVRGGILQDVNATTGAEVEAHGGWIELDYKLSPKTSLYAGYSFDDPDDADLAVASPSKNSVPYLAARWRFDDLRIGFEYMNWTTKYVSQEDGEAQRFALWISYYF